MTKIHHNIFYPKTFIYALDNSGNSVKPFWKKKNALLLSEWLEFSPYEIGIPRYGTFMKTEFFGSKFFCGKLVAAYPEPPLHYLQGKMLIWNYSLRKEQSFSIVLCMCTSNKLSKSQYDLFPGSSIDSLKDFLFLFGLACWLSISNNLRLSVGLFPYQSKTTAILAQNETRR